MSSLEWESFPWWFSGEESTCQCRRHGFNPWVRKSPWRKKQQPTPVILPGSRWASNPRPVGQDSTKNVGRCVYLTRLPKRHLPNPKSPPNPCFTARCGSLAAPPWVSRRERSCNKRTGYRLDSVHRLSASQHPGGAKKTNGQNPVWTYLLVDPPNLLLSQVHFSGGRASQNAESPRLAEKTVYLQGEEMGEQASNTRPRRQAGGVFRG